MSMILDTNNFYTIPGYEEYLISREGLVYSTKVKRLLSSTKNSCGYYTVCFTYNYIRRNLLLHRLLAFVFLDLPSLASALEVDHKDGDKNNNSLDNLAVLTKEEHITKTINDRGFNVRSLYGYICTCGGGKSYEAKQCIKCSTKINKDITQEQIEYWVSSYSWVRAARELGLSDTGLRKKYKTLSGKDPKSIKELVVKNQHAYTTGLAKEAGGADNCYSKLTTEDVLFIRANYKPYDKDFGARGLGRRYGVVHSVISKIIKGKTYKQLPSGPEG